MPTETPPKDPEQAKIEKANPPPLPGFCFKVELTLDGFRSAEAFFKSAGGLKFETEVVDVRVGGVNHTTFKLMGATKYGNIVLERGFSKDSALMKWREAWLKPTGKRPARVDVTIHQLGNDMKEAVQSWKFKRCWPVRWELSKFDASKSEVAIETLELAHEGLDPEGGKSAATPT